MSARHQDSELGLLRVLRYDGRTDPETDPLLEPDLLLRMHREMCRARLLDARMIALQRQGRIAYFGSCLGQEAVPVATALATEPTDWIFPALRESAAMLVRGFPLVSYLAQVFGNRQDVLKGRQMPSHVSARSVNQVSWSSCIATQLPHAVGAAWAAKKRGDSTVMIGFLGDGATSQPDFHAAMNFAAVFKTPSVLICQNNQWSLSLPVSRQTASATLAIKAKAYGMPGIRVDGNDALAVHSVVAGACDRARRRSEPTLIEAVTYRMGASSTSDDPTRYRSAAEDRQWASKDPIERLAKHLRHLGVLDELLEQTQMQQLRDEINAAIREAERCGPPERATLFEDVYCDAPWHLREQCRELLRQPPVRSG
jgi:pyruvate dehydrogenase E1 component alpha subunit/2-oxoisovalerate dehydrogenase E1 component alpha subunit